MPSEKELIQQIESHVTLLAQAVSDAQFWYDRILEQAEEEYQANVEKSEARYKKAVSEAQSAYEATAMSAVEDVRSITQSTGMASTPWDDPSWQSWTPATEETIPECVRMGQLEEIDAWQHFTLPAFLPLFGGENALFKASEKAKQQAAQAMQSVMLRLLATVPSGKLRFTFIDPVGLGQNVAAFMHLADYDEDLITSKVWTKPEHIDRQLDDLTEHIEVVIQKYLRNQYDTIEEYNENAGEVSESYHVLAVFDFPTNFGEDVASRLVSIAQNGPRCGVYTVVLTDTEKSLPHGFNLMDLEQVSTVITWNGEQFVWDDDDFRDCLLELDTPPETEVFNHIVNAVGKAALESSKVEVPFERIAPLPEQWWTGSTANGLRVPLGPAGARRLQYLDLGKGTAQHVLVGGKTGSGKSTLLHVLITNLVMTYSPDDVTLYLVDFKKGVEFKPYAVHKLPHARVIAIESEREFGLSVLQGIDDEIKRRGDLFRAHGVDHIADYRQKAGQRMPRILLIVDEFQEYFTEDDAVASQASQLLDRIVRQGRAFGVHVLLGSQTLAGTYTLARSTVDQMAVRIALQCSEADSRLILADDNAAARRLSRPGEAIYNNANGLVEGNHPFQVAWLPDDERDKYLAMATALAKIREYQPSHPQIVFEGNAPAEIEDNRLLHDLLSACDWAAPPSTVLAWLGEPIAIKDSTAAHFRRQSGSNLLIVGQKDKQAMGMMTTASISLAAQHSPEAARFYILDFSPVDASYADSLARLTNLLPHLVQHGRRRQVPSFISEIAAEVDSRLGAEEAALGNKPAIYLFIYGLQRARDLRQEEDFGYASFGVAEEETPPPPSPAQQFSAILREGPDLGVHTLVWCDTYTNLTRTLDRRLLREFEMRVAFQMNAEDSSNLIDTPAASKLGLYRALFNSDEEGRMERFRPYNLPSEEWLAWLEEQLQKR